LENREYTVRVVSLKVPVTTKYTNKKANKSKALFPIIYITTHELRSSYVTPPNCHKK